VIGENDYGYYVIQQMPEPVLVINLDDASTAAVVAWSVGNLHQPLQVTKEALITIDDPAVRQLCQQQHIEFSIDQRIFEPVRTVIGHHHHHHDH
jgi:urease accessory protein UreE